MSTQTIKQTLSIARLSTYEKELIKYPCFDDALSLYGWNAQISAALLVPLHICEITLRNAISEMLQIRYGNRWPWAEGFERSLPAKGSYSPKNDLLQSRKHQKKTDKVIPELNFVFWQKMLTARFDQELWQKHFYDIFPNIPNQNSKEDRQALYDTVDKIRKLRNRIAHHEPIFFRDLEQEYQLILKVIAYRCKPTAKWLEQYQQVTQLLQLNRTS